MLCAETRSGGFPYMLVGYMRVSTADERQSVDLQRDALMAAGVDDRHYYQIMPPDPGTIGRG